MTTQLALFTRTRPKGQLLKWIGSKFRYAEKIVSYFPDNYNRYIEPFVGTGAVLATLSPTDAVAGDMLEPLIDFWQLVQNDPDKLASYYENEISLFNSHREVAYQRIKNQYNHSPNPFDLLIISRTCYGGVMRFTRDNKISTPIGPHRPIPPKVFKARLLEWRDRTANTNFQFQSFQETMKNGAEGDLIYCDPPYIDSQSILYGAQEFKFNELINMIETCKQKGAMVALSIDGRKKSGERVIELKVPTDLFGREIYLDCGSSMLKRFQNGGRIMIGEDVHDRLLLTW